MSTELSIVIPTYGREQVLIDTLASLIEISTDTMETVLVDQTPRHEANVQKRLEQWNESGVIRLLRQPKPSIPAAMNFGASEAKGEVLLYLDDDIIPDPALLSKHVQVHRDRAGELIAGRVLQPWHEKDEDSEPFTGKQGEYVTEFMGGNFSIPRRLLMELGGFDENFRGAAYRFEREFADRLQVRGYRIWYEPSALIHHLHHGSGGTRSKGDHLTSWNPSHPVGAYYYLLRSGRVSGKVSKILSRLIGSVKTRHHLRKPWYIPVTLCSELFGLCWAFWLYLGGPRLPLTGVSKAG